MANHNMPKIFATNVACHSVDSYQARRNRCRSATMAVRRTKAKQLWYSYCVCMLWIIRGHLQRSMQTDDNGDLPWNTLHTKQFFSFYLFLARCFKEKARLTI